MKIIAVEQCEECPFATTMAALTYKEALWCIHSERPEPKKLESSSRFGEHSMCKIPEDCPLENDK